MTLPDADMRAVETPNLDFVVRSAAAWKRPCSEEAEHELAALKTRAAAERWVPVGERLPEAHIDVVVSYAPDVDEYPDDSYIGMACVDEFGKWIGAGDTTVTHWLERPPIPKLPAPPEAT